MRRLASFAGIVGVVLAIASPFLLSGGDVLATLHDVSLRTILVLTTVAVVSALAKAVKLQLLLRHLGQQIGFLHTLQISLATDFAFLASPAGAAGYAVNIALLRRAGAPWSLSTTIVGADQALDLLFFSVAVPVAVSLSLGPLASVLPALSLRGYVTMLIAFVALLIALWLARRRVLSTSRAMLAGMPWLRSRQEHLHRFLDEMRVHMVSLLRGDRKRSGAILLFTATQWLLRYGALWFVLAEVGHHLPFGFVLVLQAVVLHVAQWTGIPAGGGGADLGLAAALAPWVSNTTMAMVLLLWRYATLYLPLLIGLLSLVALFGSWRVASDLGHLPDEQDVEAGKS